MRQRIDRLLAPARRRVGRPVVHYLHLGKTGGTALKSVLASHPETSAARIYVHPHRVRMHRIRPGERIVFFLRDPVTRLVSGFYSRKRRGPQPNRLGWSAAEAAAFARFATPRSLAHGLIDPDPAIRRAAGAAMTEIEHVRARYWRWFGTPDALMARRKDILFIGRTERMDRDFARLARLLDLPPDAALPVDPQAAHRAPATDDRRMDARAISALSDVLKPDYEFIEFCETHLGLAPFSSQDHRAEALTL